MLCSAARKRTRNRYLGGVPPFGLCVGQNGDPVPDPQQQAALCQMRMLRDTGFGLRTVADQMAAEGLKISHVGVKNALKADAARVAD